MISVLAVDDNEAHCYVLKRLLNGFGCDVDCVMNGLTALEQAATGKYDAILLDIHLPDINGLEVCKRIRSLTDVVQPAIVFHSATSPPGTSSETLTLGDAFLTYPVEPEHIASVLQGAVARRRGNQGLRQTKD